MSDETDCGEIYDADADLQDLADLQQSLDNMSQDDLLEEAKSSFERGADLHIDLCETTKKSIVEILRLGYVLLALRKIHKAKRDWVAFREANLPAISQATCYRYMDLAERYPNPTMIQGELTLTEACGTAITIPDDDATADEPATKKTSAKSPARAKPKSTAKALRRQIAPLREMFGSLTDTEVLVEISVKDRNLLLEEIDAIVALYDKVRPNLLQSAKPVKAAHKAGARSLPPVPSSCP